MYFANSLGRNKYSFLKQQYEQMLPEFPQSHPRDRFNELLQQLCSVCSEC